MKNYLMIAVLGLMVACSSGGSGSTSTDKSSADSGSSEEGIGFNTMLPELKWHLGTEKAIQVVKDLDEKWAARNYEAMRDFFADTAICYFPDGRIAHSGDEFIEMVKVEDEGYDVSWTFDYAFSVDLDPARGGEHVQAGFTVTAVKDNIELKRYYHEWYYVVEGKIVMLKQYTIEITEE
jgi:hypothetical protein